MITIYSIRVPNATPAAQTRLVDIITFVLKGDGDSLNHMESKGTKVYLWVNYGPDAEKQNNSWLKQVAEVVKEAKFRLIKRRKDSLGRNRYTITR